MKQFIILLLTIFILSSCNTRRISVNLKECTIITVYGDTIKTYGGRLHNYIGEENVIDITGISINKDSLINKYYDKRRN